ncbi:MAG: N-acetyltransferase [Ignavibacteriae bacterium]|nr:MAG: N-acetyltransferase [Ignavibacteriota bacterium]
MDFEIKQDAEKNRFVTYVEEYEAVVEYTLKDNVIDLYRTFTPPELRGKGVAGKLVKYALEHAKENNLKVITTCSYVRGYIERHENYKELLSE